MSTKIAATNSQGTATSKSSEGIYDEDVHITYQDQSKINSFAINNTKRNELQDELAEKKKELENVREAIDELVLVDDDDVVPFQRGEIFTYLKANEASEQLEHAKSQLEDEIRTLESRIEAVKSTLGELKTQLYAKFGDKINLEEAETD